MKRFRLYVRPMLKLITPAALFLAAIMLLAAILPSAAETQAGPSAAQVTTYQDSDFSAVQDEAERLEGLQSLIVAVNGKVLMRKGFEGHEPSDVANIKSLSKTIISALVGIARDRGMLEGVGQSVVPLLAASAPEHADPRLYDITIGDLLSMRAGLEATSGTNYGAWIASRNWVKAALAQPFEDVPGGKMIYSTGNSHLLSAILTKVSGRSTLELAREWLGEPLGIDFPAWERDPQGIYLGGNNMGMSADDLLRFGEMYRNGGVHEGRRILSQDWITASWQPGGTSKWTGDRYGMGWFIRKMQGHPTYYGWGYGGQMLYVVPDLALTVVIISDPHRPSGSNGYVGKLHALVEERIIPAVAASGN